MQIRESQMVSKSGKFHENFGILVENSREITLTDGKFYDF
jgi:hypothetical protein